MITVEYLANLAISACESLAAPYMLTGALAYNYYAIPRSTKDVDIVVSVAEPGRMARIIDCLQPDIIFSPQVEFDTITWGRRHIGRPPQDSGLSVELFELFEDDFVSQQFERRMKFFSQALEREVWLPTAEDIVVQKLRWGRSKDLDDSPGRACRSRPGNPRHGLRGEMVRRSRDHGAPHRRFGKPAAPVAAITGRLQLEVVETDLPIRHRAIFHEAVEPDPGHPRRSMPRPIPHSSLSLRRPCSIKGKSKPPRSGCAAATRGRA